MAKSRRVRSSFKNTSNSHGLETAFNSGKNLQIYVKLYHLRLRHIFLALPPGKMGITRSKIALRQAAPASRLQAEMRVLGVSGPYRTRPQRRIAPFLLERHIQTLRFAWWAQRRIAPFLLEWHLLFALFGLWPQRRTATLAMRMTPGIWAYTTYTPEATKLPLSFFPSHLRLMTSFAVAGYCASSFFTSSPAEL